MDRTYFRFAKAWHGLGHTTPATGTSLIYHALCGQWINNSQVREADRVPTAGHLCQRCGRIIAARTDIEISTVGTEGEHARARQMAAEHGPDRVSDVPEPVASEQDDSV